MCTYKLAGTGMAKTRKLSNVVVSNAPSLLGSKVVTMSAQNLKKTLTVDFTSTELYLNILFSFVVLKDISFVALC